MQKLRLREGNSSNAKQPELKGGSPFPKARLSGKHFFVFFQESIFLYGQGGQRPLIGVKAKNILGDESWGANR